MAKEEGWFTRAARLVWVPWFLSAIPAALSSACGRVESSDAEAAPSREEVTTTLCEELASRGVERVEWLSQTAADGTVSITVSGYDPGFNLLYERQEQDGAVLSTKSITHELTHNGLPILSEVDEGDDGTVDAQSAFLWDADGNLLSQEDDEDADGDPEYRLLISTDDDGNILSRWEITAEKSEMTLWSEEDGRRLAQTWNEVGDLISTELQIEQVEDGKTVIFSERDDDADGVADRSMKVIQSEDGLTEERLLDTNGDRFYEVRIVTERNARGEMLRKQFDEDNDGKFESEEVYSYDELGRLLSSVIRSLLPERVEEETSGRALGEGWEVRTLGYDEQGQISYEVISILSSGNLEVERLTDDGADGSWDTIFYSASCPT